MKLKLGFIATLFSVAVEARQIPVQDFKPLITQPVYPQNKGPRVSTDEAHHNFYTAVDRYQAFAPFRALSVRFGAL
jgi:hypothetical protein